MGRELHSNFFSALKTKNLSKLIKAGIFFAVLLGVVFFALQGFLFTSEEDNYSLEINFSDPISQLHEPISSTTPSSQLLETTLSQIRSAQRTLDIAVYHLTSSQVITEINKACERGVRVRIVAEVNGTNPENLARCVEILLDQNERIMHHKFAIIDGQRVLTSSANWTDSSLFDDHNNSVLIERKAIAQAFLSEFEEMFLHRRFGRAKQDNNNERFKSGDVEIEIYFAPSDQPKSRVIELIDQALSSIELAIYALTDNEIYEALLNAQFRGVKLNAIWDFQSGDGCQFSEADEFHKQNVGVIEARPGLLHHKFAVIDEKIVITGSANWSQSGFEYNDENLLILHSESIAELYHNEFSHIHDDSRSFVSDALSPPRLERRHFAVTLKSALVQWRPHNLGVIDSYEICRTSNSTTADCDKTKLLPGWSWYYLDRDVVSGADYFYRVRNIVDGQKSDYSNVVQVHVADEIPQITSDEEASRDFRGQIVSKEFEVTEVFISQNGNLFLNSGADYQTDFSVLVPSCALERFNGSGIDLFGLTGKTIEVTGELQEYNGLEIVVTSPWQINLAQE